MLDYNEIVVRKCIVFEGEPFEVLDSHVFRKQMRKPVNATKMRSMVTGRIVEHSFHATDRVEEAELEDRKIKLLYKNKNESWFCEENDPSKRFIVSDAVIGNASKYIRTNDLVDVQTYDEKIIKFKIPIKVELKVTDAPPAVRGDTAKAGNKVITLETGANINAPMFIAEGDIVRINTETGEYVERV